MSRLFTKKGLFGIGGAAVVLSVAIGAYAYFTTSGSGTGSATVGTSSALTLHGTAASALYPGTTSTVSFTVDNPSSGHQQLGTIHLASVGACSVAWTVVSGTPTCTGTEITTCESVENGASDANTANFWMADVTSGQDFGNGNGQSVTATGTLKMNNLASSQDACKNAYLNLNFTS